MYCSLQVGTLNSDRIVIWCLIIQVHRKCHQFSILSSCCYGMALLLGFLSISENLSDGFSLLIASLKHWKRFTIDLELEALVELDRSNGKGRKIIHRCICKDIETVNCTNEICLFLSKKKNPWLLEVLSLFGSWPLSRILVFLFSSWFNKIMKLLKLCIMLIRLQLRDNLILQFLYIHDSSDVI